MNNKEILKQIKRAAQKDRKKRRDPRYVKAMAFLVGKGFLFINQTMRKGTNLRLQIDDVIWAGKNLEPRILEVLPAAVLRLGKHFDFDPTKHKELAETLEDLKGQRATGRDFLGIPYEKLKVWVNFKIKDGRVKTLQERKVTKTFRFKPQTLKKLQHLAEKSHKNITAILEDLVQNQ